MEAAPVERHEQLAPMWVVHMQNLLNMKCLQNHQELRKAGLIVECQATVLSIFVSHQWLGKGHPDKTGAQFKILQEALANIIDGFTKIELDLPMQFTGETTVLSSANREQLRNAYVWFDWFSIPQIEVKSGGNDSEEMSSHVFLSVQSIPFCVESCKLFLALVPTLPHNDFEDVSCNYCTWLDRGWCRLEIWCNLLSHNREAPMILVRDADQAEFAMPIHWVHSSAQEGNFAVESDREKVAQVMRTAFRSKLASLKGNREQVDLFRYLAAVQYRLLQLPRPSLSLESFVDHFGFEKPELTASQGMVPLACAVLSEDLEMVERLVTQYSAQLDVRLPGIAEVGLTRGRTPLHLAAMTGGPMVRQLLQLRADPNGCNTVGMSALGYSRSCEAVEVFLEQQADVNYTAPPGGLTPLAVASLFCAPTPVVQLLIHRRADVNHRGYGGAAAPLTCLAVPADGNPCLAEQVRCLVAGRADVNLCGEPTGALRVFELACRATSCIRTQSSLERIFAEISTTPLGFACLLGREPLVQLLLEQRSDPEIRNNRGHAALELAKRDTVQLLLQNFQLAPKGVSV